MAKTIKFNLICDEKPVRTLDDLREHFCVEDILSYYRNGLLQKWLSVRGYEEQLAHVNNIQETDDMGTVTQLVKIFEIEKDPSEIAKAIHILAYKQQTISEMEAYQKHNYAAETVLNNYYAGYQDLIRKIVENRNDISVIKAAIKEMNDKYLLFFDIDYRNLFYTFLICAPLALYVMLTYGAMRTKYIEKDRCDTNAENTDGQVLEKRQSLVDIINRIASKEGSGEECGSSPFEKIFAESAKEMAVRTSNDMSAIRNALNNLTKPEKLPEIFGDELKSFVGDTKEYWQDLESDKKKCMVLWMEEGCYVRSLNKRDECLCATDIRNNFVILDGIDYRSNKSSAKFFYMEV